MSEPIPPVPGWPGSAAAEEGKAPTAAAMPWGGNGEWAVLVQASSSPADLQRAIERAPAGLEFEGVYGDVDVILVYRPRDVGVSGDGDPTRRGCAGAALRAALFSDADGAPPPATQEDGEPHAIPDVGRPRTT